jgi:hypothetical protein
MAWSSGSATRRRRSASLASSLRAAGAAGRDPDGSELVGPGVGALEGAAHAAAAPMSIITTDRTSHVFIVVTPESGSLTGDVGIQPLCQILHTLKLPNSHVCSAGGFLAW